MENKNIYINFLITIFKSFLSVIFISLIIFELSIPNVIPINSKDSTRESEIKNNISMLAPKMSNKEISDITKSVMTSSLHTNIQEEIIISIGYHESRFKKDAISPKGYKGYMQATTKDIHEFAVVDIIRGSKKLEEWLKYRNGDLRFALASYNGGTHPPEISFHYADEVIALAKKLEKQSSLL